MSTDYTQLIKSFLKLNTPLILMPINNNHCCTNGNMHIMNKYKSDIDIESVNTVHGQFILIYNKDIDSKDKTNKLDKINGFKSKHVFDGAIKGCSAHINKALMSQLLEDDDDIVLIEKDNIMSSTFLSKEPPEFAINAVLWNQTITNTAPTSTDDFSNIHVYILDTGIMPNHTEFIPGQVSLDYNAILKNNKAEDDNGHGTGVASMIGGKTVGVASKTILHSIKVLDSTGSGYTSDIIAGLNWIMTNKKTPCVINMSLGGAFSSSLNTAVQNCIINNIQVICAAGNSGIDAGTSSPASAIGAITVSSYDQNKTRPTWSNFGSVVTSFGPGVSVKAAWDDSTISYYSVNGTSFSSPIIAGIIVRFLKANPNATPAQIMYFISRSNIPNEIINPGSSSTPNQRLIWNPTKINPC